MTTVVYHNNTLYADTMSSRPQPHPRGDHRNHHCEHCGEEQEYMSRAYDTSKLAVINQMRKFRGERILAVGVAGKRLENNVQIGLIQEVDDYEEFTKRVLRVIKDRGVALNTTMMVVTEKHVFLLDLRASEPNGLYVETFGRDETVAMGNGGPTAKAVIQVYGETPEYAIAVVSASVYGTGGKVDRLDLQASKLKTERIEMPTLRTKEPTPVVGRRRAVKPTIKEGTI